MDIDYTTVDHSKRSKTITILKDCLLPIVSIIGLATIIVGIPWLLLSDNSTAVDDCVKVCNVCKFCSEFNIVL